LTAKKRKELRKYSYKENFLPEADQNARKEDLKP